MSQAQPPRLTHALVGAASVFVIIFGIKLSAPILNPIALALVITIAVFPLPGKLSRRGLPGWLSLGLTVLAVVGSLALLILLISLSISRLAVQLPAYADEIAARSTALATWLESNAGALTQQPVDSTLIVRIVSTGLGSAVNLLATTIMTLLIFFFMLAAAVSLSGRSASGELADHPALARISGLTENVRRYLVITTVINLLVGAADMVLLLILGVDFALLWGISSWLLGYIPAIGFWLALIPPAVLAWAESGPLAALWVVLGYWLINGSVENLLKPRMMGQGLRISPVIVFVSLFVWGWLLGAIGALLAIPLTLLVLIILESFESTRWLVVLLQPADREEAAKGEARRRLRQTWEQAKRVVRSNESAEI